MWTEFYDMSSGGSENPEYSKIFLEFPYEQAITVFERMFNVNPLNTTCECCGPDFYIIEHENVNLDNIKYGSVFIGFANGKTVQN